MGGSIIVQSTLLCLSFSVSSFLTAFASSTNSFCLPDQRDALMEFKHLFHIQKPHLDDVACYPKTNSWGNNNNTDCCSWEGVTCPPKSGEVIGLDLSSSCLNGHFHSNSSLLTRLPHLRTLNLAFNDFSDSSIPSELGKLVGLTHLNLSGSSFSGQVPTELLHLTKLVSLDLSSYNSLSIEKSFLIKLAQNLTDLRDLHLNYLDIYSAIPQNLLNLSSLTSLSLKACGLIGEFPSNIMRMSSIRSVSLSENEDLRGHLPEFHFNDSVAKLDLTHTSFSGGIPNSIGNLKRLNELSLGNCKFSGRIPSSIGSLSYLTSLDLSENGFSGEIPSWVGNLSYLTSLGLSMNEFSGGIPSSISNLNQLSYLDVFRNRLSGSIPLGISNLTKLSGIYLSHNQLTGSFPPNMTSLSNLERFHAFGNSFVGDFPSSLLVIPSLTEIDLSGNKLSNFADFGNVPPTTGLQDLFVGDNDFSGPIPMASISKLVNLQLLDLSRWNTGENALDISPLYHLKSLGYLYLSDLKMTTALDLSLFSPFQRLARLDISGNHVSTTNTTSASQLEFLVMSGCNITEFPLFLRTIPHLSSLDLSNNMIKGQVPGWLWRLPSLYILNISHNFLSSFQASSSQQMLPESTLLSAIDVSSNGFQGPLFIPPSQYIVYLWGSNNNFTGGIPQSICALSALELLDLSHNNLDGSIPLCLGNLNSSLVVMDLRHNQLSGILPDIFVDANELRTLDLSGNRFEGKLPKSLGSCSSLEVLNVARNQIKDTFPFWLMSLQDLQVLSLHSNEFHGEVYLPGFPFGFPKLRVIDISNNHFNGTLPSDYFVGWDAISSMGSSDIFHESMNIETNGSGYQDSIVLTNKGTELAYERILKTFTTIDFSRNAFRGDIPESIGLLKGLYVLNLSSNAFMGHIPTSLANLTKLESLDMSLNNLSGRIPPELGSLTFLERMNFSYNKLTGPIPKGTQFDTQNSLSFEHNLGLCGPPLDQSCGEHKTPTSDVSETEDDEDEEEEKLSWIAVALGFAPGLLFGVTLGHIGFSYKREWLMKICGLTL